MNPKQQRKWLKKNSDFSLDSALDLVQIQPVSDIEHANLPSYMDKWYAVISGWGIIAYMASESEALHYRLSFINRILNQ